MSTVREMWSAASVLMGYWDRLSDDREEVSEGEYVSRLANLPDGVRTDMELVVLGFHSLKAAMAAFDPDQWADEAETQRVVGRYSLRLKQESDRYLALLRQTRAALFACNLRGVRQITNERQEIDGLRALEKALADPVAEILR